MFRSASLAIVVIGLAGPAHALDCNNPRDQQSMNQCAQQELEAADRDLNVVYKDARAAMREMDANAMALHKGAADALRDAQRAWIAFRDKACAAEGFLFRGGTMEPLIVSTCMADLTRRRTADLKTLAESQ